MSHIVLTGGCISFKRNKLKAPKKEDDSNLNVRLIKKAEWYELFKDMCLVISWILLLGVK